MPDIGGPEVASMGDLVQLYLRASGRRRRMVAVPLPGRIGRAYRAGGHLAPDQAVGRRTYAEFLAARLGTHDQQ